jgi:hypothetical protein
MKLRSFIRAVLVMRILPFAAVGADCIATHGGTSYWKGDESVAGIG